MNFPRSSGLAQRRVHARALAGTWCPYRLRRMDQVRDNATGWAQLDAVQKARFVPLEINLNFVVIGILQRRRSCPAWSCRAGPDCGRKRPGGQPVISPVCARHSIDTAYIACLSCEGTGYVSGCKGEAVELTPYMTWRGPRCCSIVKTAGPCPMRSCTALFRASCGGRPEHDGRRPAEGDPIASGGPSVTPSLRRRNRHAQTSSTAREPTD